MKTGFVWLIKETQRFNNMYHCFICGLSGLAHECSTWSRQYHAGITPVACMLYPDVFPPALPACDWTASIVTSRAAVYSSRLLTIPLSLDHFSMLVCWRWVTVLFTRSRFTHFSLLVFICTHTTFQIIWANFLQPGRPASYNWYVTYARCTLARRAIFIAN